MDTQWSFKQLRRISKSTRGLIGLGLILSLFLAFQNCAMNMGQDSLQGSAGKAVDVTTMSESQLATSKANAILTNKCQSCHNPQIPSGDFDITNLDQMFYLRHVVPGEPNLSGIFNAVADGVMPPSPNPHLTANEIQIIFDWIQIGFTNVPTTNNGNVTEVTPNYSSIYTRIFAPKCLACHGPNRTSGGISFANYNSTRATLVAGNPGASGLYRSVSTTTGRGGRMPQGQPALNNNELSAIFTWIQQGALNN